MKIIINGKEAVLKKGSSFEFVAENRIFSGSDEYTLSISFPLIDCPVNKEIFGHLYRKDIDLETVMFECELRDIGFYKVGALAIVEVSQAEIKGQFLEGRSVQNFVNDFDEIYINELDLDGPEESGSLKDISPEWMWRSIDRLQDYVALPWVNNYSGNMQNGVVYDSENDTYKWHQDTEGMSCQPYLLVIAERICEEIGYSYDFEEWRWSKYRHLVVCNTLPFAWGMPFFAKALPHWTVTEFFEQLEAFLSADIDIDHKRRTIKFSFSKQYHRVENQYKIEKLIDNFSAEISTDEDPGYKGSANVAYAECDHEMWKFYSCDWFLRNNEEMIVRYQTLEMLISMNAGLKQTIVGVRYSDGTNLNKVLYAEDVDTYFILRSVRTIHEGWHDPVSGMYRDLSINILQPINQFGERIVSEDNENREEIGIVPAWIDDTDASNGPCLFLDLTFGEDETGENSIYFRPASMIASGEKEEKSEYFSHLYVGFWDGTSYSKGYLPHPIIDKVTVKEDWTFVQTDYDMRLNRPAPDNFRSYLCDIDPRKKYNFQFLSNEIPNPQSLFYIQGKRYVCEKITATFSENGMSQLLKGTFYRVL